MLGVVGDGASGRATLVRGVVRLLGGGGVTPICLDDYHRYSRAERRRLALPETDPSANNLELMAEHLATLRTGGTIQKPVYDHRNGSLIGPETVSATNLIIAYGLFALTPPELAALFDLTVYLEPDEDLHQRWRLERDVAERGYTSDEVRSWQAERDRAAARFVHGQRSGADLVVRFHPPAIGPTSPDHLDVTIIARHGAAAPFDETIARLESFQSEHLRLQRGVRDDDGCTSDILEIGADLSLDVAEAIAGVICTRLPTPTPVDLGSLGMVRTPGSLVHSTTLSLTQLLVVCRLACGTGQTWPVRGDNGGC
jgi:phosphoribulokinase